MSVTIDERGWQRAEGQRAGYRTIAGPNGLLARRVPFRGNSMSAAIMADGTYAVFSYATCIATVRDGEVTVSDRRYSTTTTRQQNYCRAWL